MNYRTLIFSWLTIALFANTTACSFRRITKAKDIVYRAANAATGTGSQELNLYAPRKTDKSTEVLIFIHGGSWKSGRKELYFFLGKRFARKGVTAVVIDYPLSPRAQYDEMAASAAQAVKWTQQHIGEYGGDPDKIFVSGHSAGGHLSALITLQDAYFDTLGMANPISGAILIDAAGLDMYGYLKDHQDDEDRKYLATFTKDSATWREATPLFYLRPTMPPLLIYRGGRTYPSIIKSTETFVDTLKNYVPDPRYRIQRRKKHIPMILQFLYPWNPRYREIIRFMENSTREVNSSRR